MSALPQNLRDMQNEVEGYAKEFGLDFFKQIFEVVDYKQMNEIAAYGGFPTRYPHWKFGMEYERLSKSYEWGLSKIYEMVINNDPCFAYLLEGNHLTDQKMVMCHVYGHNDFFKNNYFFSKTKRNMLNNMANHGARVRRYIARYGHDKVERFLDVALSLENLIDYYSPFIQRRRKKDKSSDEIKTVKKIKAKSYMDSYINPKEFLDQQEAKLQEEAMREKKFPENPERDVLLFLIEQAPIEDWQRDILSIVRDEAYYFSPQAMTKIMNEGWATYWHTTLMTQRAMTDDEVIHYASNHSGAVATSGNRLNPYKLGLELFRDIENRWNEGRHGTEYDMCTDIEARMNWNTHAGEGRKKIFEVRKLYNDVTFLDTFLTPEFCIEQKLFTYGFNPKSDDWEIFSREFKKIKRQLLDNLTNMGNPLIYVEDANFKNRSELLLVHKHMGVDLKLDYAQDTLANLYEVWTKPVNILSRIEDQMRLITFNGKDHSNTVFESKDQQLRLNLL